MDRKEWWRSKRKQYNIELLVVGIICYVATTVLLFYYIEHFPEWEYTPITMMGDFVIALSVMIMANICYYLGPLAEYLLKPKNQNIFRKITFNIGRGISYLLLASWPLSVIYYVLSDKGII